jgi:DNA-binding CsgD family transcriptional regulator
MFRDGLIAAQRVGEPWTIAVCLAGLSEAAGHMGDWRRAARFATAAATLMTRSGINLGTFGLAPTEDVLKGALSHLPDAIVRAESYAGAHTPVEQVIGDALGMPEQLSALAPTDRPSNQGARRSTGIRLTEREQAVAELAAQGLTNRAIADQLVIAERTVETHLERIHAKLSIRSRAALARRLVHAEHAS